MKCGALGVSLALGGNPLGRRLLPATSGLLAQLQLLKPTVAFSRSLRVALVGGLEGVTLSV